MGLLLFFCKKTKSSSCKPKHSFNGLADSRSEKSPAARDTTAGFPAAATAVGAGAAAAAVVAVAVAAAAVDAAAAAAAEGKACAAAAAGGTGGERTQT